MMANPIQNAPLTAGPGPPPGASFQFVSRITDGLVDQLAAKRREYREVAQESERWQAEF